MKKVKVIIDTDPGVDDTTGLIFALTNPHFDVKLICACFGNVPLAKAVRNTCHILDILNLDVPVVKGYSKRLGGSKEDATFLHTKEGMGGYIPPKTTTHQPLEKDCIEAIYELLKAEPKQITFCILGPHTTFANLLIKHPDAKDLLAGVMMMGGAPKGIKSDPNHCSFNIRTDIPAFKMTLESGLSITMVPSSIGRDWGHFTVNQVEKIKKTNDIGRLIAMTYETYWEPNYPDRRIATNDVSALYSLIHPHLYKMRHADIILNEENGHISANFHHTGKFKIALGLNRPRFMKIIFSDLKKIDVKIPDLDKQEKSKKPNWDGHEDLNDADSIIVQVDEERKESARKGVKETKKSTKEAPKSKTASVKTPKSTAAKTTTTKSAAAKNKTTKK